MFGSVLRSYLDDVFGAADVLFGLHDELLITEIQCRFVCVAGQQFDWDLD